MPRSRLFRKPLSGRFGKAAAVIAFLPLAGCVAGIDSAVTATNPTGWNAGRVYSIAYDNADTVSLRNIAVLVRCEPRKLGPEGMPLAVEALAPDSSRFCDTLRIPPSCESGRRLLAIPYVKNAILRHTGPYKFSFRLAMAAEAKGVWAVGIEIKPDRNG